MLLDKDRTQIIRDARTRALGMTLVMGVCFACSSAIDPAFAYVGLMIALIASGMRYVWLDEQLDRHEGRS